MAGDWIKMRCNLGTDPRVLRIADGLGLPELHVVGLLWRFWSWADQHTTSDAVSVTEALVDRITCDGFALQLRSVGWLEVNESGVRLPNFEEHNGQTAKQRALTGRRMKRYRDARSVTSASPEKRREEKRVLIQEGAGEVVPSAIDTPDFRAAWSDWKQHRREKRKPVTPLSAKQALLELEAMGSERAVAAIRHSIGKGWVGIFPPDRSGAAKPQPVVGTYKPAEGDY